MKLTPVGAPILRRYLEATFGGAPETAAAVEGATLDEYVALRRIRFPGSTPQGAATAAPTRELRDAGLATARWIVEQLVQRGLRDTLSQHE